MVNIRKTIDVWQQLASSKGPKCESYTTVVIAVNDQLATAKLQFLPLQPFLEFHHSDFSMIRFTSDDIINIVKTLMKLFIKANVVDSCFYKDL